MRKISLTNQLKVLFDGGTTVIGASLLLVCFLFSFLMLDSSDWKSIYFIGDKTPIMAHVTAVIPQQENIRILYQYTVEEKKYPGEFYTKEDRYQTGDYIEIEFAKISPKQSRLLNEETSIPLIGTGIVFVIGLLLMALDFKKNAQTWVLINWGKVTRGTLASKEKTNKGILIVTFHYKDSEGHVHELIERTTDSQGAYFQISEPIVHLPKRPKVAILVSKIPSDITLYDI